MGCFIASGSGWLAITEVHMNSALYHKTLRENVTSSVCELMYTGVMQQHNDPQRKCLLMLPLFYGRFCLSTWHSFELDTHIKKKNDLSFWQHDFLRGSGQKRSTHPVAWKNFWQPAAQCVVLNIFQDVILCSFSLPLFAAVASFFFVSVVMREFATHEKLTSMHLYSTSSPLLSSAIQVCICGWWELQTVNLSHKKINITVNNSNIQNTAQR